MKNSILTALMCALTLTGALAHNATASELGGGGAMTGVFLGFGVGGQRVEADATGVASMSETGAIGQAVAIAQYDFGGLVVGGEAQASYADNKASADCSAPIGFAGINCASQQQVSFALLGRVGFAFGGFMPYATAGFAVAPNTSAGLEGFGVKLSQELDYDGKAFGGGVMWRAADWVAVDVQYLKIDYDTEELSVPAIAFSQDVEMEEQRVVARVLFPIWR